MSMCLDEELVALTLKAHSLDISATKELIALTPKAHSPELSSLLSSLYVQSHSFFFLILTLFRYFSDMAAFLTTGSQHILYHADGKTVMSHERYNANGQKHGKQEGCHENGVPAYCFEFDNGKQHGEQDTFYENGNKETNMSYHTGERYGVQTEYHWNGRVACSYVCIKGKIVGKQEFFDEDGIKTRELNYDENGRLNGLQTNFYSSPGPVVVQKYYNGKLLAPK